MPKAVAPFFLASHRGERHRLYAKLPRPGPVHRVVLPHGELARLVTRYREPRAALTDRRLSMTEAPRVRMLIEPHPSTCTTLRACGIAFTSPAAVPVMEDLLDGKPAAHPPERFGRTRGAGDRAAVGAQTRWSTSPEQGGVTRRMPPRAGSCCSRTPTSSCRTRSCPRRWAPIRATRRPIPRGSAGSSPASGTRADMILNRRFNVYSAEVEQALMAHSAMRYCAVSGNA